MKPPTKDLSVTIALALMSIFLIEGATMRKHGFFGFFKHLGSPTPIMAPMNVLEIGIRPLSLCLRLFGNVEVKKDIRSTMLIGCALAEATAIYGLLVSIMLIFVV